MLFIISTSSLHVIFHQDKVTKTLFFRINTFIDNNTAEGINKYNIDTPYRK